MARNITAYVAAWPAIKKEMPVDARDMPSISAARLLKRSPRYPAPTVVPQEVIWLAVSSAPNCDPVKPRPILISGMRIALMPELKTCLIACPATTTTASKLRPGAIEGAARSVDPGTAPVASCSAIRGNRSLGSTRWLDHSGCSSGAQAAGSVKGSTLAGLSTSIRWIDSSVKPRRRILGTIDSRMYA